MKKLIRFVAEWVGLWTHKETQRKVETRAVKFLKDLHTSNEYTYINRTGKDIILVRPNGVRQLIPALYGGHDFMLNEYLVGPRDFAIIEHSKKMSILSDISTKDDTEDLYLKAKQHQHRASQKDFKELQGCGHDHENIGTELRRLGMEYITVVVERDTLEENIDGVYIPEYGFTVGFKTNDEKIKNKCRETTRSGSIKGAGVFVTASVSSAKYGDFSLLVGNNVFNISCKELACSESDDHVQITTTDETGNVIAVDSLPIEEIIEGKHEGIEFYENEYAAKGRLAELASHDDMVKSYEEKIKQARVVIEKERKEKATLQEKLNKANGDLAKLKGDDTQKKAGALSSMVNMFMSVITFILPFLKS